MFLKYDYCKSQMSWLSPLALILCIGISLGLISSFCGLGHSEDDKSSSSTSPYTNSSSVQDSCPPIISRAEWDARAPKAVTPMSLPVNVTIIHHSATGGCSTTPACIRLVKAIQNFHMDDRGWNDIGYSFLIGGDGNVYEGRGWNKTGAHSPGYNDKSIGICVLGNFMDHLPTDAQLAVTKDLIACGVLKDYIIPDYLLYGHRDVRATLCPGNLLYQEISQWPHKAPAP